MEVHTPGGDAKSILRYVLVVGGKKTTSVDYQTYDELVRRGEQWPRTMIIYGGREDSQVTCMHNACRYPVQYRSKWPLNPRDFIF